MTWESEAWWDREGVARRVCSVYLEGQHYVLWLRGARADQMKRACRRQRQHSVKERAKPQHGKHVGETEKGKFLKNQRIHNQHAHPAAQKKSPIVKRREQSETSLCSEIEKCQPESVFKNQWWISLQFKCRLSLKQLALCQWHLRHKASQRCISSYI